MTNMRDIVESGLSLTLEDPNGFGNPVYLVDPDGNQHGPYYGQVCFNTYAYSGSVSRTDNVSANESVYREPVVVLRRSSLSRVPSDLDDGKWIVKVSDLPFSDGSMVSYVMSRAIESGGSIGFIRLYLTRIDQ